MIERFNRTMGKMIQNYVSKHKNDWDMYLQLLMAAYRSTVHPATGFSPNMMMFGREVTVPGDLLYPLPGKTKDQEEYEYIINLRKHQEECYNIARGNLKRAVEYQKRNYDVRAKMNQYSPGDVVFRRNPIKKKLETPWLGPMVVMKCLGGPIYRIQGKTKSCVLHHDLLKPFHGKMPRWILKIQKNIKQD